jgi:8-oxo-dGTP pyrophosphatase MutT (NUDIX family)
MEDKYIRKVQTSVNCFLYCNDDYLFLHRSNKKRVDPGKLNGIGGRLEPGENFLNAAIREVEEETGYIIKPKDVELSGVVKLEGGYEEDWIMCFFKVKVRNKNIPRGTKTDDGNLEWIHKDKVLDSGYEVIDDLNYCFKDIIKGDNLFFMTAKVNSEEKIYDMSLTRMRE